MDNELDLLFTEEQIRFAKALVQAEKEYLFTKKTEQAPMSKEDKENE